MFDPICQFQEGLDYLGGLAVNSNLMAHHLRAFLPWKLCKEIKCTKTAQSHHPWGVLGKIK
jgi:hypothetical protein